MGDALKARHVAKTFSLDRFLQRGGIRALTCVGGAGFGVAAICFAEQRDG
jgi:hypothetical protein